MTVGVIGVCVTPTVASVNIYTAYTLVHSNSYSKRMASLMRTEYVPSINDTQEVLDNTNTWADPINVPIDQMGKRKTWVNNELVSFSKYGIFYDFMDKPINPHIKESTGKKGRGSLGKWGANHAADPLITRQYKNGTYAVLVIFRGDQEGLVPALPGGMVDIVKGRIESYNRTLKRELCEEAVEDDKKEAINELKKAIDNGSLIYCGFVNDPRTTDNAWIETFCLHAHISEHIAESLNLRSTGTIDNETKGAIWMDVTPENMQEMYAGHGVWVYDAIEFKEATDEKHYVNEHIKVLSFISIILAIIMTVVVAFIINVCMEVTTDIVNENKIEFEEMNNTEEID